MTVDPHSSPAPGTNTADIRPIVARHRGPTPAWLLIGGVILGGVLLFGVLDGQRRAATAPSTQVRTVDRVNMPTALPPLYLPAEPPPPPPLPSGPEVLIVTPSPVPVVAQSSRMPAPAPAPLPNYPAPAFASPGPTPASAQVAVQAGGNGAVLVVDTTASPAGARGEGATADDQDPVRTTRLARRAMTVPQGSLIPAVLETALDSTRPGHVRAIVSRDITGFDGSQVLISRGTRLFGDYQSDMAPGQSRGCCQANAKRSPAKSA